MWPGSRVARDSEAKKLRDVIEHNFEIDKSDPPRLITEYQTEEPCFWSNTRSWPARSDHCYTVSYWVEHVFIPDTQNVTAVRHVSQEWDRRTGDKKATRTLEHATAVLHHEAAGWELSTQLDAGADEDSPLRGKFSRGPKNAEKATETKKLDHKKLYTCPPWHICKLRTTTWHAEVSGMCERVPKFKCKSVTEVCETNINDLQCSSYQAYHRKQCKESIPKRGKCSFKVPMLDRHGKPLTKTRLVVEDLRPGFVRCDKNNDKYVWITTGELYYPDKNLYLDPKASKKEWYPKPENKPPPRMPDVHPCPMPEVPKLD